MTFKDRMLAKYGKNLNLSNFTTAELERLAKDVQREVNRRLDIASKRPQLRQTKAYKNIMRSGGKLSLSKGFQWVKGARTWEPNQSTAKRREYLGMEIRRGLQYTSAQTSTYTGFKKYREDQRQGLISALIAYGNASGATGTANRIMSFLDSLSEEELNKFWTFIGQFEDRHWMTYVKLGSPAVVEDMVEVWKKFNGKSDKFMFEKLEEYVYSRIANDVSVTEEEAAAAARKSDYT